MTADLQNPIFTDEDKAREFIESERWPDGAFCPHCGETEAVRKLAGKSHRPGLHQCNSCRKNFTVTVGTLYERSHIPLTKWLLASYLLSTSKKGMSAHQLHRMLGVTYKTAWFMAHRIREAMTDSSPPPFTGPSVQADETYFGTRKDKATVTTSGRPFTRGGKTGPSNKRAVVGLVGDGRSRMFHVRRADVATVTGILIDNVAPATALHTDESRLYVQAGKAFAAHKTVRHAQGEWVRDGAHTNNIENYFSIFKRGMTGVYQHCSEKHLQRYLNEFDFRYSNRTITDAERAVLTVRGIVGKRLTYRNVNAKNGKAKAA